MSIESGAQGGPRKAIDKIGEDILKGKRAGDPFAYIQLAQSKLELGRTDEAMTDLDIAIALSDNNPRARAAAFRLRASFHKGDGNLKEASTDMPRVIGSLSQIADSDPDVAKELDEANQEWLRLETEQPGDL